MIDAFLLKCGCRTSEGEISTIGKIPTIKNIMCGDKIVMESSGNFYSYRADVNFQTIEVALASLFILG